MNRIVKNTVVALAFLMAVGTAWTAQPVSETYPIGPGAEVDIDVLSGTVTIVAGSGGLVEVTGTLGDGVESLEIDGDEDGVYIEVEYDEHYHGKQQVDTDLTIRVPAGVVLSVETVSASISVDGVTGELDLETVSGNVEIATMPAALDIETVSGNISVASAPADSDVSSVSGHIEIQAAGGSIDVENVSGKTMIYGGFIDDGDLESVSGDITCHAIPGPDGSLDIETMSGTITLMIDTTLVASFDLSTFSGLIENQVGPEPTRTSKYTPGKELYFNTGTGGPNISLESFSGSIKLITR
ncbi:MAG: DUF4097 domain-containing protein [Acidobacteriota bacterium]|jgi:DUF4097 and DUF4098 domain-containing protein YvlB|nr:DUF4097 domain-containing protein [Acidobacteriota bacterium]